MQKNAKNYNELKKIKNDTLHSDTRSYDWLGKNTRQFHDTERRGKTNADTGVVMID